MLKPGRATPEGARVHRFFENVFQLVPDIHVREGERAMVRLASAGLVGGVSAIEMAPMRLRVRGTAGSGKSSLALRLVAADRRVRPPGQPVPQPGQIRFETIHRFKGQEAAGRGQARPRGAGAVVRHDPRHGAP